MSSIQETEVRLAENVEAGDLSSWYALEKAVKDTVSGQDSVMLQSTCQPVFNNMTNNHLQPRAVVGETIFVKVSLENMFNTALQIRKAYLLWKFTPEDSEDAIMNDKKDASTNEFVDTGVLETTVIEKSSTSEMTFYVTCMSPGQLTLVGVEYSIKAMFPDKEPTDHEIRGKQMFSITPPHVNSVKDRKNLSGVGVDRRLEILVMQRLPKLESSLTVPDTLCDGEMRCCELELRNRGQVDMTNVFLVCQTPGLLSFGPRKQEEGDTSMFEFPLIQDSGPQFRKLTQDGRVEQTSLDLMTVPLADNIITAGSKVKIPVWIRGPPVSESHRLFVYYDTVTCPTKHTPRILPITLQMSSQPSIQVSCQRQGHVCHNNVPGRQFRLTISNVSKDLAVSMETITVVQVSLVSRDQILSSVQCSDVGCEVSRGDTTNIVLTTAMVDTIPDKWRDVEDLATLPANVIIPGGHVHVSSVTASNTSGYPVHSPPHTHFMKKYFAHNLGRKGNPPILSSDLCLVTWRSGGSSPIHGQCIVPIEDVLHDHDPVQGPVTEYPVSVNIEMENEDCDHDFVKTRQCGVPGHIALTPLGQSSVLCQYNIREQIKGARIIGNTGKISDFEQQFF